MGKSLRGKRLKRLGLFWVGVFLSFSLWAQTGVICGTVTDAKIKEPLIGASVVIEGTTVGAITDIDGNFRIENVKPGTYTVAASYVSYQTQTVKDVPVVACQEAVLNIELSDANLQLQNVVVVAQRKLGTEMAVLNTVRKSLPVVNGISAQQISKTQDSDAAEVLRRIPGITIVDDRFIVVRGLAQRYNNVWLNNATTPSSETDSRAFSFDVLPSSLIDNMMIYKSPSAELPADFSGGFVRVMTKNIPDGNTFNVSYQMGFNTNATFRNFQLTDGTAKDYLGFGADVRNLPSSFPAHLGEHSTDEAAAFTRQINQRWGINKFTAIPDQKISLTSHRSYDVGGWKIGNITNLNWSTEFDYSETVNNNYIAYDVKNDVSRPRFEYNDIRYKNTSKLGALFNWSFQRDGSKYELRNFFSQRGVSALTQREGMNYYSDKDIRKWESLYTGRTTYSGQISGVHTLRENVNKVDWTVGYAFASYREPDRKIVNSILDENRTEQPNYYVSDPMRYYQELKDHSASLAANYEHKFTVSDRFAPVLNGGVYGEYKSRTFAARRFGYNLLGSGYDRYADWDYTELFADENISADKIWMRETTTNSDSYTSENMLGAAYVSAKLNYGEVLNANIGVRMEYYQLKMDGYSSDGTTPVHLDNKTTDFFPSVNVAYNLSQKHLVRAAYGRSVNRPEFREVVPYVYFNFERDASIVGNTELKNAYADNIDLRYEFYPAAGEMITIGGFYKHFKDPIEETYNEAGSGLQYTYHNAKNAETFGVELDVKKNLDFIGLRGLSFVCNAAYIYSRVRFEEGAPERDRPLAGQSPYLVNAGFFYQYDDKGISASLLYNRIGKRIESVGVPMQNQDEDIPDIYEMPRNSLDLTFSKKIGKIVEIKAGIQDILNSKVEYKQFVKLTDDKGGKSEREQLIRSYRPGVDINIGVSLRF